MIETVHDHVFKYLVVSDQQSKTQRHSITMILIREKWKILTLEKQELVIFSILYFFKKLLK